ncbi:MAG: hypothetical protein PF694_09110 [Bacteroidetes bacterium]|jgi:ethanolamine utilization cobalamin adenosyltransferase|nr:hypothetical protein [Bacteroidota bacterium]
MAKNDLPALRDHLFEVIERLKSNQDPDASECEKIDINTAKAITDTAKTIIESAKVEVDFLKLISDEEGIPGVKREAERTKFLLSKNNQAND